MPSKKTFVDKSVKSLTPEQVQALLASRWGEDQTLAANPDTYARLMGRDADGFQLNAGGGDSIGGNTEGGFTGKYNDFTREGTTISRKRADGLFDSFDANGKYLGTSNDGNGWSAKDWATFAAVVAGAGAATGSFGAAGASGAGTTGGTSAGAVDAAALGLDGAAAAGGTSAGAVDVAALGLDGVAATGAELGANGAFLGEGVSSGVGGWDAAAVKSAVGSGELGTAASYAGQNLANGTLTDTASSLVNGASTADSLADAGGKSNVTTTDGWGTLARIGGGLITAGLAGDALSNPVDTSRYNQLFDNLIAEQKVASQRGTDLWTDYQNTWKPLQQKFADTALNYDTPERRETAANAATGEVAQQYDIQRGQAERDMVRAGVDPSTIYALGTASRLDEAKARAAAANNARDATEKTGLDLLGAGVNQGNTVVNQGTQQSQVATGTTQAAGNILNSQANVQNANTANKNAIIGDLFTAGTTAYGMYTSSKKTKHMGKKVDGLDAAKAVQKSPAKHWKYRKGEGDGNTKARMGPTAESLKKVAPAVSDGKQVDGIAQLGLHHAAIGGIAKRMERIEQKLGLGDARRRA